MALIVSGQVGGWSGGEHGYDEERSDPAVVARAEARGELVRLRTGVHVRRACFEAVCARRRHLLRIRALMRVQGSAIVLGGASAAAVHGLPRLAPWPAHVTLLEVPGVPPCRRSGVRVIRDPARGRSAYVPGPGGVRLPGLAATALAASHDAAMDAVRAADARAPGWLAHGLVAVDDALSARRAEPSNRADLHAERLLRGPGPWSRRAELLVASADGGARTPVESIARGVAHELGLAGPVVGHEVPGHGRLALAWPAARVGLRILEPRSSGVSRAPVGAAPDARWRVVEAGSRDVLAAGRLRALLLGAGLEPERRAEPRSASGSHPRRSSGSAPLGWAGE